MIHYWLIVFSYRLYKTLYHQLSSNDNPRLFQCVATVLIISSKPMAANSKICIYEYDSISINNMYTFNTNLNLKTKIFIIYQIKFV